MAVQIRCPACRAGVVVQNSKYLVVLNCHACGREFLADAEKLSAGLVLPETTEPDELWTEDAQTTQKETWREADDDPAVLMFCPMCGELAPESVPACSSCGEPLPIDSPHRPEGSDAASRPARRFRQHARLLGGLWILLAYVLARHDLWIGGTQVALPSVLFGGELTIPPIPLMASILICLGAFALVGQFWAVAAGGLLNYVILFFVVWQVNFLSLALITLSIILTHYVLHHASTARLH